MIKSFSNLRAKQGRERRIEGSRKRADGIKIAQAEKFDIDQVVKLRTPEHHRNEWFVILNKTDKEYTGVVEVDSGKVDCEQTVTFTDKDVKWPIGTRTEDMVNLGPERHAEEVVTLIEDAQKCKR